MQEIPIGQDSCTNKILKMNKLSNLMALCSNPRVSVSVHFSLQRFGLYINSHVLTLSSAIYETVNMLSSPDFALLPMKQLTNRLVIAL